MFAFRRRASYNYRMAVAPGMQGADARAENIAMNARTTPRRRTQAERSEAMRQRLIDATILSLESEGYAGTTVSTIITAAAVSRGAPIHHFPTKAALIAATAEHLVRRLYVHLGYAICAIEDSDDRLNAMILASWREVFGTSESVALMELMMASRRDAELANVMRQIWITGYETLDTASRHYFEALDPDVNPTQLFALTHWLMSGMALERHLMDGEHVEHHFLALWSRVLRGYMKPRDGVTTPPPKPRQWDRNL